MISKRESEIITLLKVFAIIGVVLIHTPKPTSVDYIKSLMDNITISCVPIFFLLSGFFLFRKEIERPSNAIFEIKKRIKTLFTPFVFWNALILILALIVLHFAPSLSKGGPYTINDVSFNTINKALWGIDRYPIHYQFWFIRNLMIFVLISPIFKILLKKSPWFGIVLSFLLHQWISGAIFFYLGGIIITYSSSSILIVKKPLVTMGLSLAVFLTAIIIEIPQTVVLFASFSFFISLANFEKLSFALSGKNNSISNYVFFIYATHEPLMTFSNKIVNKIVKTTYPIEIVKFLVFPTIIILFSWFIGILLKKYFKMIYNFSTGTR